MIQTNGQVHIQSVGSKPEALSLFTGAGGLDIGFHRMGFDIVACVEVEPIFCKTPARK
ncbi:MAG TPA: DNA cytosine methyltransferase [Ktedonobacteraceae bacterium]|nr:DNA cytosine methyltransferase [Ktedonobacteraceae bacterium]